MCKNCEVCYVDHESFEGPDTRSGKDRREFCPMHIKQVEQTSTLAGMVKVLIGIVAAFGLSMVVIAGTMLWVGLGIDKTFSAYISGHTAEADRWIAAIQMNALGVDKNATGIEQNRDQLFLIREEQDNHSSHLRQILKERGEVP